MIRTDYQFKASLNEIQFTNEIDLNKLGLIVNITAGIIIYSRSSGGTVSGNILTLTYNTSAMADSDTLQIFYSEDACCDPLTVDQLRAAELRVSLSDDPVYGDSGPLQQHEKEQPNWPARELMTYDSNIATILGTQNLVNLGRLQVQQSFAPEQMFTGVLSRQNDEFIIPLSGQATITIQLS
jgi:hypothetical protein